VEAKKAGEDLYEPEINEPKIIPTSKDRLRTSNA
jgi:hypothetical protein